MIKKQVYLIYPFKYVSKPKETDETISKDQLFEFLPYVKSFFTKQYKNIIIKKLDIKKSFSLYFKESKKEYIEELTIHDSKIIFFQYNIAILSIKITLPDELLEEDVSFITKNISNISNMTNTKILDILPSRIISTRKYTNNFTNFEYDKVKIINVQKKEEVIIKDFRCNTEDIIDEDIIKAVLNNKNQFYSALESAQSTSSWIQSMINPYILSFNESNFLNLEYLNIYSLLMIDDDSNEAQEPFIDSILLRYRFSNEYSGPIEHNGIRKIIYGNNIKIYSNLNGTIAVAKNNQYNQQTFLNHFGKNIFLIYLFVILQKSILIDLINQADNKADFKHEKYQNQKDDILYYLRHIDFTQLSNSPVRNEIYKFYRSTHEIKDLIHEIKIIIEYYNSLKDKEDEKIASKRFRNFEILIALIGIVPILIEFKEEIYSIFSQVYKFLFSLT